MRSLYEMIYVFLGNIMNTNAELSPATELVAICFTLFITYFILLFPFKLVLDWILGRKRR